jgi:hypothetical protein
LFTKSSRIRNGSFKFPISGAFETMQLQIERPKVSLEMVADRILALRQLTPLDRNMLESAILSQKFLSRSEKTLMTRVFDGLHQGSIQLVD